MEDIDIEPVPNFLVDTCSKFLVRNCCHNVLIDFHFDRQCIAIILSKLIGYGIIVGSTIVKIPQLLKILVAKSGSGISIISVMFEILAYAFNASYSYSKQFPFSSWGESLFLLIETVLIAYFILWFETKRGLAIGFVITFGGMFAVLMSGWASPHMLWYLQAANLPLTIIAKLLQASNNYKNKHTGQLSAITTLLLFGGSLSRIFTSIQETGDNMLIYTFAAASVANCILVVQLLYYWKSTNEFLTKKDVKKRD